MGDSHHHHSLSRKGDTRAREAYKVTLIGSFVDFVVGTSKLIAGLIVGSGALVADGIHSFSDLVTDFLVLVAIRVGNQEPDSNHPYGHGRIETLATLWLGLALVFVAGGIVWASLSRLFAGEFALAPGAWAISIAVVALVAKEWIFHYTMRIAKRFNSRLLEANAWHSRSDALSTVAVLIGLIAAQLGVGWLDAWAAIVVGAMIGHIGGRLLWDSSQELIDRALPENERRAMQQVAEQVPGVRSVHDLRTRSLGSEAFLDLHIVVSPRITVSEGHEIGNEVSRRLRESFPALADVVFHIDPEEDNLDGSEPALRPGPPLRGEVEDMLEQVWHDIDIWHDRVAVNLHYLDDQVDISIFISELPSSRSLDQAVAELNAASRTLSWIGELHIWQGSETQIQQLSEGLD